MCRKLALAATALMLVLAAPALAKAPSPDAQAAAANVQANAQDRLAAERLGQGGEGVVGCPQHEGPLGPAHEVGPGLSRPAEQQDVRLSGERPQRIRRVAPGPLQDGDLAHGAPYRAGRGQARAITFALAGLYSAASRHGDWKGGA